MCRCSSSIPVRWKNCSRRLSRRYLLRSSERSVRVASDSKISAIDSTVRSLINFRRAARLLARRCHMFSAGPMRVSVSRIETVYHKIDKKVLDNFTRPFIIAVTLDECCFIPFSGTNSDDTLSVYAVSVPEQFARPLALFSQATRFPISACSLFSANSAFESVLIQSVHALCEVKARGH